MRRLRFRWSIFALALVAAALLHGYAVPRLLRPLLEKPETPIEIAYFDDSPQTDDPIKPPDSLLEPLKERPPDDRRRPEPPRPDVAIVTPRPEEQKPEEKKPDEKPVVPLPPPPPPPPPQPMPYHQTMVDQDKFPDEADNPDAKYLGQKNHRAAKDTRARNTNLVKDQQGKLDSPTAPSERPKTDPNVGGPDSRIAELMRRPGLPRELVRSRPSAGDEGKADRSKPGPLSMRGLTPKAVDNAPDAKREGLELRDPEAGPLPQARAGETGERAGQKKKGARYNFQLSPLDYDKIVGEAVAERERRQAARAEVSRAPGRWDRIQKKVAALRSSLENFTPEALVGRESELGTRKHPFAAYIAEMHRGIHKLWAFGFLETLDSKSPLDPYNDMERVVMIGIVVKPDGVVERVTINRPSGYAPFDAAALDVVLSSSPFPEPPASIKSADGKVYLDWTFHRDDRQCGTFGVFPHILTDVKGEKHADRSAHPHM